LKKAPSPGPTETIKSYFTLLGAKRIDDARGLLDPSFQDRLGKDGIDTLLHSVKSATVTDVVDAITWANQFGSHLPAAPADRREYLVTLQVEPSPTDDTWAFGVNRRFIDLAQHDGEWRIQGIDVMPGPLVTGQTPGVVSTGPSTIVIPVAPLRLGPAPMDPVIYAARQRAADRGEATWAADPLQVTRRDGPSFGIDPRDSIAVDGEDRDPVSLNSRTIVRVAHVPDALLVTLEQPVRTGPGGVWAITSVRTAPAENMGTLDATPTSQ
jgi:hypothetical protein